MNITEQYIQAVKSISISPRYRIFLLNENESVKSTLTGSLRKGGNNLTINYQQGLRRSLTLVLDNRDGSLTPNENTKLLWFGTKIRLELGLQLEDGTVYWNPAGVFAIGEPSVNKKDKSVSLQCSDKFALLNGEIGGSLDGTYEIPVGTNIFKAMKDIIYNDNGKGRPIDTKIILFDRNYKSVNTSYTLTHNSDSSLGAILIDLANMIACDIYYNEDGNLVVKSGTDDISNIKKPIIWSFKAGDLEYNSPVVNYNFMKVKNRVTVIGTNPTSGVMITAIAENTNPKSPISVKKIGTKNYYVEDENITTQILAQNRADYELKKISILGLSINIEATYMIHLDVDNCIQIEDDYYNFVDEKFIIQSINIPLDNGGKIAIQCSNIMELPYFPGIK